MKQYILYIAKQLGGAALIIAFSLTSIVWLTQALRFIDFIVNRGVSALTFVKLTALLVPSLLFTVLPFSVFVSVLFIYNRLIGDSELVVLRSAGLSRFHLSKPALLAGATATLFAYFISLYALPVSYRQFKDMQTFLRDNYASLLLQEEVFNTPVEGLTVFVRKRESNGLLRGILVHDSRDLANPVTMMAQQGQLQQTSKGPRFLLYNGNRQEMRDGRLSYLKFESYTVDLSFYTQQVSARERKPEEMFLPEILTAARQDPERHAELMAEFHHRLLWPIYNLALAALAAVVMLTGEFNRRGNWQRIALSSMAAVAVVATDMIMENLFVARPALAPLSYISVGLIFAGITWALRDRRFSPIPKGEPLS